MKIELLPLEGVALLSPQVFQDDRGYFVETFNTLKTADSVLADYEWVQENESLSQQAVLRGLHFQKGDAAQAKLVRVIKGEVFDVMVDLRLSSPTFGKWHGQVLSGENKLQLLVPRGFAHGFMVLSESAIFSYKCDNHYNKAEESGILYNDPELSIDWPTIETPIQLSDKDMQLQSFANSYKFES